jgi:hypothetical protein
MKIPQFAAENSIYKTSQSYQSQNVSGRQLGENQIVISQMRSNFSCYHCIWVCAGGAIACAACLTVCDIKDAN